MAIAGKLKEWESSTNLDTLDLQKIPDLNSRKRFTLGFLFCVLSGIFSSMLNIGLVFGKEIANNAFKHTGNQLVVNNAVWPIAIGSGFVVNFIYSSYLLQKNNGWKKFFYLSDETQPLFHEEDQNSFKIISLNWFLSCLMGILWFGGIILYGLGSSTTLMGSLGPVVGWPIFITAQILTGIFP